MSNQRRRFIPLVVVLLLAAVGILLLVVPTKDIKEPPKYMYGVVVDAGSSHTSMYIYKWPSDKENGTGVITQHSECHVKGGGISSYAGKRGGAARSLESCLEQAVKEIPRSRHRLSPLYLGATAGMRLLNKTNPTESQWILEEVRNKLRSYPFNFRGATILSGYHEGAYGWVTVNYLLENFVKYGFVGHWMNPGRDSVGALDFGGASTQITFETSERLEDSNNMMTLRLYGRDYRLYTHSFLCYGRDQFLRTLLAHLIKVQGLGPTLSHPCYPADFNVSINLGKEIFDSPCTEKYRPTSLGPQVSVVVQGTGDYQRCLGNVSQIFSFDMCSYSKCSFDGVFQPNVTGRFMAFSGFFYTHYFLEQASGIVISSLSHLDGAIHAVCNMSFSEMLTKAPSQEKYLKDYCAVANFMQVLMIKGYRFDDLSFPRISFQKKAGDASIGWALGYMLSLSSLLPAESIGLMKALPPGAWTGILIIFVLLFLIVLGHLLKLTRQKKGDGRVF
ncbi:ectonucleoside triphosphate diphosphohydrolase 2-like [Polymixia lowei]